MRHDAIDGTPTVTCSVSKDSGWQEWRAPDNNVKGRWPTVTAEPFNVSVALNRKS